MGKKEFFPFCWTSWQLPYQGDDVVVLCVFLKLPHIDCVLDHVTVLQDQHHHYHHCPVRPLLLITLETLSVKLMEYLGTGGPPSSQGSIAGRGKRLTRSLQGCWLIPGRGEEDGERPGESGPKVNVKLMTIVMVAMMLQRWWQIWCRRLWWPVYWWVIRVRRGGLGSITMAGSISMPKRSLIEMMITKQ